jgi:hypothetical protein
MAAGMMPKGGGGVLGWDPFGNQAANPRPSRSDFVSHGGMGAASIQDAMRFRTQGDRRFGSQPGMPVETQTAQQYQDFQQANKDWAAIEAARKKRQEAYAAMAQKTGPTPAAFNQNRGGGIRQAGDPLTMGRAPAYEMALYGQPRKWREQIPSIVNLRTA